MAQHTFRSSYGNVVQRLWAIREAGYTERCHIVPHHGEYNVGLHSWNVAMLLHQLHPDPSKDLILAALTHDAAERWTGDIPYTAKHFIVPGMKPFLTDAEEVIHEKLGIYFHITKADECWLKACDMLELLMWSLDQQRMGNLNVEQIRETVRENLKGDWVPGEVQELAAKLICDRRTTDFFTEKDNVAG